jgi:antitoxin component YwqK of YwqJK toxin-antitoxin module
MKKNVVNKNEKNQLHGIQIGYDYTGKIWFKENYINGKKHGIQIGYYMDGQIEYKHNYINGKEHGEQIVYHDNGDIMYKYNYINGRGVSKEEYLNYERRSKLTIIKDL